MDKFKILNNKIIACRKCPRLVAWREEVAQAKRKAYQDWEYWGRPVPGFGDHNARVLVVGLAPGAHGSNRTGRQFTGDASGKFLYPALYRAGFASQPDSTDRDDGLILHDMYITASGRCAPPSNKPTSEELDNCQPFLERELELLKPKVIVVLGRIAFERVLKILSHLQAVDSTLLPRSTSFSHGAVFPLHPSLSSVPSSSFILPPSSFALSPSSSSSLPPSSFPSYLLCSYHPSQQNTLTGKLTVKMFDEIWKKTKELINE
jgi:uracil-DNA glycosylase family 4